MTIHSHTYWGLFKGSTMYEILDEGMAVALEMKTELSNVLRSRSPWQLIARLHGDRRVMTGFEKSAWEIVWIEEEC